MCIRTHLDKRTNVLVLDGTLATKLVETTTVGAVSHALVLEITLATLVANGAVERVIGQQELHDTLTGLVNEGRVGLDDHTGLDGPCARGNGLGGALDLDETHTTVTGDHELLVVAVAGDGGAGLFAGLDEGGAGCEERVRRGDSTEVVVSGSIPSIETFLPSGSACQSCRMRLQVLDRRRTDCELDLSRTRGGRGEGAGGIERRQPLRARQTAQELLAHHVV